MFRISHALSVMFPRHWFPQGLGHLTDLGQMQAVVRAARLHPAELRYLPDSVLDRITYAERVWGRLLGVFSWRSVTRLVPGKYRARRSPIIGSSF